MCCHLQPPQVPKWLQKGSWRKLEGVTINLTKAHDPLNLSDHDTVTIAGDNTVFILVRTEEDTKDLVQKVKKMISE